MRTTTADYKAAIYATDRECRGYIKFNNDGTKIIRGVDGLISITLHEQLCDEERPMMNCACSRYVEVEFFNSGLPGGVSLANSYIDTYMGVVTKDTGTAPVGSIEPDTATVEYIWNGRFFITEIDRGKLSTKVLAYDELSKLNKQYVPTVTKGVSGYAKDDIYVDVLTQCGFTNTAGGLSGYVQDLYDCTCRQMVGWLLGSVTLGCNVRMSRTSSWNVASTTLKTQWGYKDNTDHEITDNEIYLGGLADGDTFTVNSVTTGTADNPIVVGSGTGIVGENPYLTQANATTIYNDVNGITFKPMTIEFRGNPAIDTCDVLKVTSGGTSNYCWVQRLTTTFNGGIKQKIECFGDSAFYYSTELSPTNAQIKNAVSSMAQEIQQEIETADNGVITKVLDLDGSWKELVIANNQDLSAATSVWRWNINGLAHSTAYSGGTYNFAVDMNGRIIADAIQTGILTDALGKNSWNLDTGAFTITDGSINITTSGQYSDKIVLSYTSGNNSYKTSLTPSYIEVLYTNSNTPSLNRSFQYSSSGLDSGVLEPNGSGNGFTTRFYLRNDSIRMVDATTFGITLLDSSIGLRITDDWNDSNKVELKPSSLIFLDSTATPEITIKKYSSQSVNTAPSTTIDLYGFNVYKGNGSVAVVRAGLTENGLTFRNSSNTVTATYPADPTNFLKDNGLSVASLKDCTSETASTSGTTKTYTLTNGTYLITTAKYNNSSTANDGVWLASVYTGGTSHLSALLAPTGTTTVSISGATLTIVTGTNNERITITHLNF